MRLPRDPEDSLPMLAAFGAAIAVGKLLASSSVLTWRRVFGRAIEGAGLCMSAGVILVLPDVFESLSGLKSIPTIALLGFGGLLASLGVSGLLALVRAVRGGKA